MQINPNEGISSQQPTYGLGDNVEAPQEEAKANTIFAEFNDKDGKVGADDVKFSQESDNRWAGLINSILRDNAGKEWTGTLKNKINLLINNFNLSMRKTEVQDKTLAVNADVAEVGDYEKAFEDFDGQVGSEYDTHKADSIAQQEAFQVSANSQMLNFEANNEKLTNEFKAESMGKLLEFLKEDGVTGEVSAKGVGSIRWDAKAGSYVLTKEDGTQKPIDSADLQRVISVIAESGVDISGSAVKKVPQFGQ